MAVPSNQLKTPTKAAASVAANGNGVGERSIFTSPAGSALSPSVSPQPMTPGTPVTPAGATAPTTPASAELYKNYFKAAISGTPVSVTSSPTGAPDTPDSSTTDDETPRKAQSSQGAAPASNFLTFFEKQKLVPASNKNHGNTKSMFVDDEADADDDVAGDDEIEDELDAELASFIASESQITPRKDAEPATFFAHQLQDDRAELEAIAERFVRPHNPLAADSLRATTQSLPAPSISRYNRITTSTSELDVPVKQRKISSDDKLIQATTDIQTRDGFVSDDSDDEMDEEARTVYKQKVALKYLNHESQEATEAQGGNSRSAYQHDEDSQQLLMRVKRSRTRSLQRSRSGNVNFSALNKSLLVSSKARPQLRRYLLL